MTTSTPNTPQELLDLQKSDVDKVLDALSETSLYDTHTVVQIVLCHMKKRYLECHEEMNDQQFLWDACKIGTCLQVFNSLAVMQEKKDA